MKKLTSLFLSLMLVFSLAIGASANSDTNLDDPDGTTTEDPVTDENNTEQLGSITISGASNLNVYTIYRMLDLESYKGEAYSYRVNSEWTKFFQQENVQQYMTVDTAGYATWVGADEESRVIAFSKLALEYAQKEENNVTAVATSEGNEHFIGTDDNGNVYGRFSGLPLGYYLVDSTMGALCGLTTTDLNATINAKNVAPTIEKDVKEDSSNTWAKSNTAGINETVEYRVKINITGGAQNFVLHDTMSAGLTFVPNSVQVFLNNATDPLLNTDNKYFTVTVCKGSHKTPAPDASDVEHYETDCTFDVKFNTEFYSLISKGDAVWVHYNAVLDEDATIDATGDTNKAILGFGEGHYSNEETVNTLTYGFDIVKTDDKSKTMLSGAEFLLYDAETAGNQIKVLARTDANGKTFYRVATPAELEAAGKPDGDVMVTPEGGIVRVVGFDINNANEAYYLQEEKAPEGYNKLTSRHRFQITATSGSLYAGTVEGAYAEGTGVQVKNKTGAVLPTTGAMGTTMFLTFGSFVVLATGVLLVTKKRMTMIEE